MRRSLATTMAVVMTALQAFAAVPAQAATEVFSGWIVSTDRNRYRVRIRMPNGQRRALWMQVENVWRNGRLVGRKILSPGMRVTVTARRHNGPWKASRVQVM